MMPDKQKKGGIQKVNEKAWSQTKRVGLGKAHILERGWETREGQGFRREKR